MTRPIGTNPVGLLQLLKLRNLGQNPVEMLDSVTPVIETRDLYERSEEREIEPGGVAVLNVGAAITGITPIVLVPQNNWWWVENFSFVLSANNAGSVLNGFAPILITRSNPPARYYTLWEEGVKFLSAVAGTFPAACGGFWAPPGSQLGAYGDVSAFSWNMTVTGLRYVPYVV